MGPNSDEALLRRREAASLTWRAPALMLFARTALAVGAQAAFAGIFALQGSPTPWYLRLRRLLPFAMAHALMDGAGVVLSLLTA